MSKKNRRKSLKAQETLIPKNQFSVDDSKMYIIATIIMFHVVPLAFMVLGNNGKELYQFAYFTVNPLFLGITGLIYGMKKGFDLKFPFLMFVFSFFSVVFYNAFKADVLIPEILAFGIVYLLFSYAATVIGAFIKKLFRL